MRNGLGYKNISESQDFLHKIQSNNEKIGHILEQVPQTDRAKIAELRKLAREQSELIEQNPRFSSAEERFKIDQEKFNAMHLLQRCIRFLRDQDLKTRGAQQGNRCG
jgi:hypothetical protein